MAVIGQIAHIYAAIDGGPRGKPGLTEKERNLPDNLILLCPTHHVVVDQQHPTYPASLLIEWRSTHERKFQEVLGAQISDIGFNELELAARSLMSPQSDASIGSLKTIPPDEKIKKNGLGGRSKMLLTMGAANSAEVEQVLLKASQLDRDFADKLREGFVEKYRVFFEEGLRGDDLFMAIYAWAGGASRDKMREAGGLCILAHLFLICDVFEK